MGFNSSHSAGESCSRLEAVGQTGASIGAVARKFGVACDARVKGKAEAELPISGMYSMTELLRICFLVNNQ